METLDQMAREGDGRTVMISCEMDLGLEWLIECIWQVSIRISGQVWTHSAQELGLVK